ncbi:MAG: hypothetical protein ACTSRI_19760 [Promethearchaeota archaeon]
MLTKSFKLLTHLSTERKARKEQQEELEHFMDLGLFSDNKILRDEKNSCSLSIKRFCKKKVKRSNKKGKEFLFKADSLELELFLSFFNLNYNLQKKVLVFPLTLIKLIYYWLLNI